ncbi:Molybdopterin converting factor, small subunit [Desulfocicer vacuolatum DSM 3385]|uniref:Molybdopterin converting factor, small subunit n=1 Tax=Desulfocicer vacuolatum DSM 3385 TaxID=1121400 RepID=A0A1W2DT33_9BACT|nr:MoaD/ThiS family protein [Desulfocicer vacuolatum]SMD00630.1 Molybdopterin converting factor, small subunit [Desulfocicer vacuolatum DSM 3385]
MTPPNHKTDAGTEDNEKFIKITFNAFSFLQKKLNKNGFDYYNVTQKIPRGSTINDLLARLKLQQKDVEGVFLNGLIKPFDTVIQDGDRLGLLPPGTPGPYRVMLGIVKGDKTK